MAEEDVLRSLLREWTQEGREGLTWQELRELAQQFNFQKNEGELMKAYLRALKQGSLPVSYAGLMLIGYGGIGKSSLLCGLKNQPLPDEASSTLVADGHMISDTFRPSQSSWAFSKGHFFWKDVTEEEEYFEMARLVKKVHLSLETKMTYPDLPKEAISRLLFQHQQVQIVIERVLSYIPRLDAKVFDECECWIRIWDCGGQKIFRTILPAFITPKTMFLLLFNASHDLHENCMSTYNHPGFKPVISEENITVLELLLKWMATIHASLTKESLKNQDTRTCEINFKYPKIIPVGTHGDDELVKRNASSIIHAITEACEGKAFASLVEDHIIVDNTTAGRGSQEDPNYTVIREHVRNFAKSLTCDTPITWVLFRKVLFQLSKSKPVVTLPEVCEVASACNICDADVKDVLHFYHSFGVFFHYSHISSLKNKVILDPQWLVKVIADLLPIESSGKGGNPNMWRIFKRYGILVQPLYEDVLRQQEYLSAEEIVGLLTDFLIIGQIHTSSKKHSYLGKEYFVPCMLSEVKKSKNHSKLSPMYSPAPLHLVFSTNYLPPGFFTRFAAILSTNEKFEVLFDEICCNKIRYAYGVPYERAEEITIIEGNQSVQIIIHHINGSTYEEFLTSCHEIVEQITSFSEEVLKWLPGIKMNVALKCQHCTEQREHFIILHTSSLSKKSASLLRCQNDYKAQLNHTELFWIAVFLGDAHMKTIQKSKQDHLQVSTNAKGYSMNSCSTESQLLIDNQDAKKCSTSSEHVLLHKTDIPFWNTQIREMRYFHLIRYYDSVTFESKELKMLDELASNWEVVADILGFRPPEVEAIRNAGAGKTPFQCIRDIMTRWMQNADSMPFSKRYPCNWKGFYNVLVDSKLSEIGNNLKAALKASLSDLHHNFDDFVCNSGVPVVSSSPTISVVSTTSRPCLSSPSTLVSSMSNYHATIMTSPTHTISTANTLSSTSTAEIFTTVSSTSNAEIFTTVSSTLTAVTFTTVSSTSTTDTSTTASSIFSTSTTKTFTTVTTKSCRKKRSRNAVDDELSKRWKPNDSKRISKRPSRL